MDQENIVINKIKTNFIDSNVSFVYEDICKEKMWELMAEGKIKDSLDKMGSWWNGNQEIDIVVIESTGNDIIFGECKYYTNKVMEVKCFYELKEKAKLVEWKNDSRKETYILFSVTGYSKELKELEKVRNDLILV